VTEVVRGAQRAGFVYPEWDYRVGAYQEHGAVVRVRTPPLGDPAWAEDVLARRAALLHEVRRRFERLRPRRRRLGRQLDGPEVDLAAYVAAYADRLAGCATDDRLYEAIRPARRDVAIALLVDVSGSTDSWIMHDLRVVDVEKEALLVVCDALDALGDPYTIQAFSGEGPECVSLLPIKTFEERSDSMVRRRIAALEPDRYTRMGAALRHTTGLLMGRPARHRLLLVLSDGKPNDVDRYEGRYGVEDARQAVAEARLQGLHPFCVTVDRQAPAYMPRIFGAGGYAALQHPEHLPSVLVEVLRRLVRA
jgi:nitric oxide reductase NorD protein